VDLTVIYLSLGSNVGNRRKFLKDAIDKLSKRIDGILSSSIYETEPWGKLDQAWFLNLCIKGHTELSPEELLSFTKSVEVDLGRKHTTRWGPREIDIDILFYGNRVIESDKIKIPHPYLAKRAFVLTPLAEIAADFIHPVIRKNIAHLSEQIGSGGIKRIKDG
jgi:2-amino-4-hydroxy-6-hydroxymethyldihydropteridine diphosphokinase